MSSRTASKSLSFEIKNVHLPLMSVLVKSADLQLLNADLQHRFGDTPDFFDNDPVLIDLHALDPQAGPVDINALLHLLRRYRITPVELREGNPVQEAAATLAGLFVAQEMRSLPAQASAPEAVIREVEVVREVPAAAQSAMVIDKPVRSGQHVYARGRDLVVLAMVNPGAEIMSDGHIHVYAPLRGKAIAGAKGDTSARIFAASLEAELVSIAGVYRTSDPPLPVDVQGKAAQVWLAGDKLHMRAL